MSHAITTFGLIAGLCGLALMLRHGFRSGSRLDFGGTMSPTDRASGTAFERHGGDVKGRLGFALVVLSIAILAAVAYSR